jgi:nucleotide-binding universal stress UspA family protein
MAMRVLIGVDGSQGSLAAVKFAGQLLTADKDAVTLYYSPPPVSVRTVPDASGTASSLQNYLATAVFRKAREQLPAEIQRTAENIVGTREPRSGLLIAADDRRADLIVIGARGTGPSKQPALGSLARHVVHHATIPVLVVRRGLDAPKQPVHLLLASDGSDVSQHASEVLQCFSWPAGTIGWTITVAESAAEGQIPEWLADQLDDQQLACLGMGGFARHQEEQGRLHRETEAWYGKLPAIFQAHDPLVVTGHVGDQILRAIDANRIDLVVVGARRQGPVRRLLLGSTSEYVLNHASCSVLIVHGQQRP